MNKQEFFKEKTNIISASAPGRLDVMGGVADYSGSLLLQMPIKERTNVSLITRQDTWVKIFSQNAAEHGSVSLVEIDLNNFNLSERDLNLTKIRMEIKSKPGGDWASYVVGCFILLIHQNLMPMRGSDIFVESEVPIGKGVSSSAALEVATICALKKAYNFSLGDMELPILAQKVENLIVGAPCGLMDQISSYLGEKHKLLPIKCQPAEVFPSVSIPKGVQFVGLDSDVKHSVAGNHYAKVRSAAFMGYTIIALNCGATVQEIELARNSGEWTKLPFGGYLANIPVKEFSNRFTTLLPEKISGKDFLEKYHVSIDKVTTIHPDETYLIKVCAAHPVLENNRIEQFKTILIDAGKNNMISIDDLSRMGNFMIESHQSYSACGLGNEFTDEIVEMVQQFGIDSGVFGAKITGGGSGGTVCIITYQLKGMETARIIKERYEKKYNKKVVFFEDSGMGAKFTMD